MSEQTRSPSSDQMSLSHFSKEPYLRHIYSRKQECPDYRSCFDKPRGLWVSVDGEYDWEHWCTSESFGIGQYRHRVHLRPNANVLFIPTACDLRAFREQWGVERPDRFHDVYIPWERVAEAYQGIIIAPYQWSCRMEENWYYGWDCASGCIWDAEAIYCVEPLREAA